MTREEALNLAPGDKILITGNPYDDSTDNIPEYKDVWGTTQIVKEIDRVSNYCVGVESGVCFHYNEVVQIIHSDIEELIISDDPDIKLLFGGDD